MCSAVCSFAPQSQTAVEAIHYLCIFEQNRPTPVQRQFSLTHAGLEKLISSGVGLISLINVWSREAFSRHSMLFLFSAHGATLVPDWAESFSSSNAAGTNGCLDFGCQSFHQVETGTFHIKSILVLEHSELDTVKLFGGNSVGWMPDKIKSLSVAVGRRDQVTICKHY